MNIYKISDFTTKIFKFSDTPTNKKNAKFVITKHLQSEKNQMYERFVKKKKLITISVSKIVEQLMNVSTVLR